MQTLFTQLDRLTDIGIALSSVRDTPKLLETILIAAKEMTGADGGTLYSVNEEEGNVRIEIIRTDSLNIAMGGTTDKPVPFDAIPLYHGKEPNHANVVTYAALTKNTINIEDAYNTEQFDLSGTRKFDSETGYRSQSFLTVPMKNHQNDIIGVLQLINALDDNGTVIPFSDEAQRLVEALASQAAIALTNRKLIDELKELLESLIHLIAYAIDEKSPYTGGHCRRVPVLTMELAEAAASTTDGPLGEFTMSDDDRYELEIAAWLHDCGKITTPEYVVDKATKLQTIYDRIETVDSRFEIIKRDWEIAKLKQEIAALRNGEEPDSETLQQTFDSNVQQLKEEREFLRTANIGGEFMDEALQARVRDIANHRWTDLDGKQQPLLTDDEVYNLNISKGTLTDEERQIINNHIVASINILDALPFPKQLRRVPEFAGGHHERMDGKGYPKGLTGDQMSPQARMMAIADVFEALTARDRPYKTGKKLSTSLAILKDMAKTGHVDPDLYRIFIEHRIFEKYANEYLDPEQIDDVDIKALIS